MLLVCVTLPAEAHQGESHGVAEIVSAQRYEPRTEASTEQVEVTVIAQSVTRPGQLWVFVNHRQDNTPWVGLKVEVESGKHKAGAESVAPGAYRAPAAWLDRPGKHLLTLTLQGEGIEELLSAELTIPSDATVAGPAAAPTPAALPQWSLWAATAAVLAVGLGWFLNRRSSS
jgi:hypothetical protein